MQAELNCAGLGASTSHFPQSQRIPSMGTHLKLTASDGHKFGAYRVDPAGTPKGGIVVIQEIFGVNRHIRSVADVLLRSVTSRLRRPRSIALKRGSNAAI